MNVNSIIDLLINDSGDQTSSDFLQRNFTAIISCFGIAPISVVLLIVSIINSNTTLAILSGVLTLVILLSIYAIKTKPNKEVYLLVPSIATALLYVLALIFSKNNSTYLIFLVLICFFIYLSIGVKKGKHVSLITGLVIVAVLLIPFRGNNAYDISIYTKLIAIITYFLIHFLSLIILQYLDKKNLMLQKTVLDKDNESRLYEELMAKLSHQIRTPLNNIMIISNLLSKANLDENYADMVDTIQASSSNLVSVLNSMVNVTTADALAESNAKVQFSLSNAINSTIKMFSTQSNDVGFSFKMSSTISKLFVGDPIKLKQVFLNVIESIIKNKSGQKVNIEISVNEDRNNRLMFEFTSNKTLHIPTSKGALFSEASHSMIDLLDLAISQQIVHRNGGELSVNIEAETAVIKFTYSLNSSSPRTIVQSDNSDVVEIEDSKIVYTTDNAVDLSNANVLLVEDNLINQKIVILSLKKVVKGIEVANNGKEALDKFGTSKYDIILMDIQMPVMNGYVTTKKIREIETSINTHTPIIAITANALLGDREECIASGMDDYISKPFQIEVLIQKMKSLLAAK